MAKRKVAKRKYNIDHNKHVAETCPLCNIETPTYLEFNDKELVELWKKLKYKENSVWVNLRNKIEAEADICLHCGKLLDDDCDD